MNEFAWRPVLMKDISVGNLVSCFTAKKPRHITRIEKVNGLITLFEKSNDSEKVYLESKSENHPIDLLINCKTLLPATIDQVTS